jgi:hypothetical protein
MVVGNLKKFDRNRSCSAGSALLLFSLNTSCIFSAAMLPVSLFILSNGLVSQAHGEAAPAYVSSSALVPAPGPADLPDAPAPSQVSSQGSQPSIPFLSPRLGRPLQPMGVGDKFKYFVEPAFGPRTLFTDALSTGIRMANPPSHYPPEWHGGAEAFGRLYGDTFARTGAESIGRFSTSVLLHEDPRYRRSESTFVPTRLGHAFVFTFIDQTDGGHRTIAMSNFTGAAAGGFIGNAYLPAGFDDLTHAGQRSAFAFGGMAAQNVLQEFSPELGRALKKLHVPHIPLPPVWWTGDK